MDFLNLSFNTRSKKIVALAFILETILSVLAADMGNMFFLWLYFASLLLNVAIIPGFTGRENCAMFALLALTSIPVNLHIVYLVEEGTMVDIFQEKHIIIALWGALLYAVLFSLEQIVAGVIVRLIWPDQRYYSEESVE